MILFRYLAHIASRRQRRKRQEEQGASSGDQSAPMEVQDLTIVSNSPCLSPSLPLCLCLFVSHEYLALNLFCVAQDCTNSDECYEIPCQILSLPANHSASVTILGYVDERFFGVRCVHACM